MKTARIYTDDLNRLIAATKSFMMPQSDRRDEYKYIKLEFDKESSIVTAIAVDGYRLSMEHAVISNCNDSFIAYLFNPPKFPAKEFATVELENFETYKTLVIRCNKVSFGFKQPGIIDPSDWKTYVPSVKPTFRIGFNANYLLDALKAAKASCGNAFNAPIVLEFTDPNAAVLIRTNKGEDIKLVLPIRLKDQERGEK